MVYIEVEFGKTIHMHGYTRQHQPISIAALALNHHALTCVLVLCMLDMFSISLSLVIIPMPSFVGGHVSNFSILASMHVPIPWSFIFRSWSVEPHPTKSVGCQAI